MAELKHTPDPNSPEARQYAIRVAAVRAAKARKLSAGVEWLTPAELDAVLPPVSCRRTRDRIAKKCR